MADRSAPRARFEAPWSPLLKFLSTAVTLLFLGISVYATLGAPFRPLHGGAALAARLLPLAILAGSALFTVRGYRLVDGRLEVQRLLWWTAVPLDALQRAWVAPDAMSGSFRLFGNGGLYSFSGLYRNSRLGSFRAFATNRRNAVVLELSDRKIVVTPDSPREFVAQLESGSALRPIDPE